MPEWILTLILRLHSNVIFDEQHQPHTLKKSVNLPCREKPVKDLFPLFPTLPFFFFTHETISTHLSSFTMDRLTRTGNSNLTAVVKYRPTYHFYSVDSSWQLRGTTTGWRYMKGSLSDDRKGKIESSDVMETRPQTDIMKEASLSAPVQHHSYPRSMSVSTKHK